jgi:hypothetical protein
MAFQPKFIPGEQFKLFGLLGVGLKGSQMCVIGPHKLNLSEILCVKQLINVIAA